MRKIKTFIRLLFKDRNRFWISLGQKGYLNYTSDKWYLSRIYKEHIGEKLNLDNPITYNEKIQWIKLYDRKTEYIKRVDKYEVRNFVKDKIGEEYLIPIIGIYNSVEEIQWDKLPNKFVLKCTHSSHANIICLDKEKLDIEHSKKLLRGWMNNNLFWFGREWAYKDVPPRIICEEFMDNNGKEIDDFKVMCFNGEPRLIQHHQNRTENHTLDFYDKNWNKTTIAQGVPTSSNITHRPEKLNEMLDISRSLAENTYFSRIDLYYINNKIYFGEITYYPTSGLTPFDNKKDDILIGSWINLN